MVQSVEYSREVIRYEARRLVNKGLISRRQPIYALCQYIPVREWERVQFELEKNDFLLRDCLLDLLGREDWDDD
jgi:hypothetical protein